MPAIVPGVSPWPTLEELAHERLAVALDELNRFAERLEPDRSARKNRLLTILRLSYEKALTQDYENAATCGGADNTGV